MAEAVKTLVWIYVQGRGEQWNASAIFRGGEQHMGNDIYKTEAEARAFADGLRRGFALFAEGAEPPMKTDGFTYGATVGYDYVRQGVILSEATAPPQ